MLDRLSPPGVSTHVYANRTVVGANTALHTARRVWNDLSGCQNRMPAGFLPKQTKKAHNRIVVLFLEKLWVILKL